MAPQGQGAIIGKGQIQQPFDVDVNHETLALHHHSPFSISVTESRWALIVKKKVSTMSTPDVIRGWKDEEYRLSLSQEQRSMLPDHPAGVIELVDEELDAAGGTVTTMVTILTVLTPTIIIAGVGYCWGNE
jgi:mersacidin/lichenicidin family type 2 lantibiotic